jgi:hypothetical protein
MLGAWQCGTALELSVTAMLAVGLIRPDLYGRITPPTLSAYKLIERITKA